MQWVVTTGRSVAEARGRALDAPGTASLIRATGLLAGRTSPPTPFTGRRRTVVRVLHTVEHAPVRTCSVGASDTPVAVHAHRWTSLCQVVSRLSR